MRPWFPLFITDTLILRLVFVCVNFLFAFEGPYSCLSHMSVIPLRKSHDFPLVKTGVRVLHVKFELACFHFYWLYITVQTALPIKWKLWVSGAKLGGQHLAAHFSLGTPQGETGCKRKGWLPQWFELIQGQTHLPVLWCIFSSLPHRHRRMD